jgi:hypothetical protein
LAARLDPQAAGATSIQPFAAIRQGRNRFAFTETGWWRIAAGLLLRFVLIALHPPVYGVNLWRYFS